MGFSIEFDNYRFLLAPRHRGLLQRCINIYQQNQYQNTSSRRRPMYPPSLWERESGNCSPGTRRWKPYRRRWGSSGRKSRRLIYDEKSVEFCAAGTWTSQLPFRCDCGQAVNACGKPVRSTPVFFMGFPHTRAMTFTNCPHPSFIIHRIKKYN